MQHRKTERAGQHDVAGRGLALLPQHDRPGEQAERQHDRHHGMKDAELFEIEQAPAPRIHFAVDGGVEAPVLAGETAERPHQRHIADDVDHFAVDGGGLVGKVVMQRPPGGGQAEHQAHHDAGEAGKAQSHRQADGANQRDRRDRRHAGRQHVPDEHVLGGENGVRGCGDAADQRAREAVGEIGRRMAHQVAEQIAAQVAADTDEGEIRDPARDPPQQIIGGDQRAEQEERRPHPGGIVIGQHIDQKLDAVLSADRAHHRDQHRGQDDRMRQRSQPDIAKDESEGAGGVFTEIGHACLNSACECRRPPRPNPEDLTQKA